MQWSFGLQSSTFFLLSNSKIHVSLSTNWLEVMIPRHWCLLFLLVNVTISITHYIWVKTEIASGRLISYEAEIAFRQLVHCTQVQTMSATSFAQAISWQPLSSSFLSAHWRPRSIEKEKELYLVGCPYSHFVEHVCYPIPSPSFCRTED